MGCILEVMLRIAQTYANIQLGISKTFDKHTNQVASWLLPSYVCGRTDRIIANHTAPYGNRELCSTFKMLFCIFGIFYIAAPVNKTAVNFYENEQENR